MNLAHCDVCPRRCGVNRLAGELGFCHAGEKVRLGLVSLHRWEEPCLTGPGGAGTVFFSYCSLGCIYCQNYQISGQAQGIDVSTERLRDIFLEQQERGAATLDLVTPTHYLPQVAEALKGAKARGLTIPVVYNSGGYELESSIEELRGLVDVFLPDLKYFGAEPARRYSQAPDYFEKASRVIEKMFQITGPFCLDPKGLMVRGLLVRHLVLPGLYRDSFKVLDYLWKTFGDRIMISLMNQYTPMGEAASCPEINRKVTTLEYQKVLDYAQSLGFTNCFIQGRRAASEDFVPAFDGSGVLKS